MRKLILNSLLGLLSCLLVGCSAQIKLAGLPLQQTVIVKGANLERRADIPRIDPNDPNAIYAISQDDGNYVVIVREHKAPSIKLEKPGTIHCDWIYGEKIPIIEGKVKSTGKKYPIAIDSGFSHTLSVHDLHVIENKLPILPIQSREEHSIGEGLCHLSELQIGKMTLTNFPCYYKEQHAETQLLGLPIACDMRILFGLGVMKAFKYILFDNLKKEVKFSPQNSFEPGAPALWSQYPFSIKKGREDHDYICTEIPIVGEKMELKLDTCATGGLYIKERVWKPMGNKLKNAKTMDGNVWLPRGLGRVACKNVVVEALEVGKRSIKNAKISVFPNDSMFPESQNCQGLLGMRYFRDTVVVLDFEHNLMWVKNK